MRDFFCQCGNTLYFQNNMCLQCGRSVGYVPRAALMTAIEPIGHGRWQVPAAGQIAGREYKLCENTAIYDACNWLVPADDPHALCVSCRLTRTIPDLGVERHLELWRRIEAAKRHLLYSLTALKLPIIGREADPERGLVFDFLADADAASEFTDPLPGHEPVTTGHANGLITLNIAEADDVARARMREQMGEHYRTLLGHFRHEIGHYYWMQLIEDGPYLAGFRRLFGDERSDYGAALTRHYEQGPPPDWSKHYISRYASAHPWEDWAECWAHYLHMRDTLETAANHDLVKPRPWQRDATDFDTLTYQWTQLTIAVNAVNRSMGLPDAYPFALNVAASQKLAFIHDIVDRAGHAQH
ncbi:zinc-binding metallopeptidase family protein [Salinisphaera hydrothermalis]|uniref:zinc-binding metallopeptidase family protein n=1 Tax=Salinisphaera hydrothermalis TaxID=563188 RepID=UPI003342C0D7